ncbi:MAG: PQQ-like beta-propeller repeat protein [Opitutaceae bacterium]|nr:PQQ-like beta-propeller repeat protein [Opitutaceae bacterium]
MAAVGLAAARCIASDWPEFRGPTGQGHSTAAGLPVEWSDTRNVAWKIEVPGSGWSSPVVGGGRVFLTTGIAGEGETISLRVLAYSVSTGERAWETEVFAPGELKPQPRHKKNSHASPTPILEGERVYVHFGAHGTACLDRAGKVLWRNNGNSYDSVHGNGGSPALVGDLLIYSADGEAGPAVVALDKASGAVRWRSARVAQVKQKFSFSTPLAITVSGRVQVVSPGSGAVMALDPVDGREIWRARYGNGYSVVPRPVLAHGSIFIGTGYNRADLLAVRVDGAGDVTDTHIVWRTTKGAPLTPSLLVIGDELYGVDDKGVATCWDARSGEVRWQERIDGNYSASPLAAEGRIYFLSEEGVATVVKAGRTFEKLAVNKLGERALASMAAVPGALLIRGEKHLFRIAGPRG